MAPPRKPPGMSFQSFTDAQIEKARREGLFEDLPGKGKPLENLRDAYDPLWWAKKMVQREGVSILPPALEIRKTVEREMKRLMSLHIESKVRAGVEKLNAEILRVNSGNVSGPPTTQPLLDVDAVVARWRATRAQESP